MSHQADYCRAYPDVECAATHFLVPSASRDERQTQPHRFVPNHYHSHRRALIASGVRTGLPRQTGGCGRLRFFTSTPEHSSGHVAFSNCRLGNGGPLDARDRLSIRMKRQSRPTLILNRSPRPNLSQAWSPGFMTFLGTDIEQISVRIRPGPGTAVRGLSLGKAARSSGLPADHAAIRTRSDRGHGRRVCRHPRLSGLRVPFAMTTYRE